MLKYLGLAGVMLLCWGTTGQAQTVEYYHLDALGSIRAVTDANGNVIARHDFLPFGEEWGGVASSGRLFTGKVRDSETGLDYSGARYYRADIGRFTTVDPVYTWQENLTDPQRWNRYTYVRNNPLRYTDPTGLYLVGCGGVATKECSQQMDRFEKKRQEALKSKDPNVAAAAKAYGNPGDKGVVVTPVGGTKSGTSMLWPGTEIQVSIAENAPNFLRAVVHEGVHVQQFDRFRQSFDKESGTWDRTLNILNGQAEIEAWNIALRIAPFDAGPRFGTLRAGDGPALLHYLANVYSGVFNNPITGDPRWRF